jgi:hypothetical protein
MKKTNQTIICRVKDSQHEGYRCINKFRFELGPMFGMIKRGEYNFGKDCDDCRRPNPDPSYAQRTEWANEAKAIVGADR